MSVPGPSTAAANSGRYGLLRHGRIQFFCGQSVRGRFCGLRARPSVPDRQPPHRLALGHVSAPRRRRDLLDPAEPAQCHRRRAVPRWAPRLRDRRRPGLLGQATPPRGRDGRAVQARSPSPVRGLVGLGSRSPASAALRGALVVRRALRVSPRPGRARVRSAFWPCIRAVRGADPPARARGLPRRGDRERAPRGRVRGVIDAWCSGTSVTIAIGLGQVVRSWT
jgi:hypothetical protein